ncbi:MAG: FAD:protein FMN transferase [Planctomycetota bacterium]|nr:MAG: FAD:protein FMN transferase [Planctomycetota bacterium]
MTTRDAEPRMWRFAHDAMACTFELLLVHDQREYARQAAAAAFEEIDRLERELSRFVPDSDVSQINALRAGQTLRVGVDTANCLRLAIEMHALTGGAFDVTVRHAPDADPSDRSAPRGAMSLAIDATEPVVCAPAAGVRVDLGGIGKGYAVDRVRELLAEWGISSGVIHAGQSSALAFGTDPRGAEWSVLLRDPQRPETALGRVALRDRSLSGSGQALHGDHIIDPRSGAPAAARPAAWALAPSAAVSDALSTALMILSRSEIETLCARRPDVGAVLLENAGGAEPVVALGAACVEPAG